jgi:hypothetical protein
VRGIKQALGDSVYGHVLREVFRPKAGPDSRRFTRVHAALVGLPFRGLATTNYDPGLIEARLALRPDVIGTGYAKWKDADPVQRWLTGEAFEPGTLPILFAHGVYERSDTIVLGAGEYRDAYRLGGYRRLFDKLWSQDRLVFVGFGFSDPWLDFLADEVITQTAANAAGEPRHIAIVGLDEGEEYTPESRRTFQDQYNAAVYFYRVGRTADGAPDHGELVRVLEGLGGAPPQKRRAPAAERGAGADRRSGALDARDDGGRAVRRAGGRARSAGEVGRRSRGARDRGDGDGGAGQDLADRALAAEEAGGGRSADARAVRVELLREARRR